MAIKSFLTTAALLASATAQNFSTYTDGSHSIAISIPDATAQSGSGVMFFQIGVPSGTQWLAFGQGTMMSNADMFVVYSSGSAPVLSTRSTTGHNMPQYNGNIQATMLSGSGIQSDGSMVVNVQCNNCLGSNMSPTDTNSNWIMAYKAGSPVGSSDTNAAIQQHDTHQNLNIDLTKGIGGSSTNPFAASSSGTATTSASGTTASSTGIISSPIASSSPNSGSSSSSSDNTLTLRTAHAVIMSLLFVGFFPLFALTLYLSTAGKVRYIHAPLQLLSVVLLIVGMALGIVVGGRLEELDTYHQIIGFIVVAFLVLVQPAMGIMQHLHYHKTGGRSVFGPVHQNLGRFMIILGVINGGLGLHQAGNTGGYVPYAVVSAIVFFVYVGVVVWSKFGTKSRHSIPIDKEDKSPNGYEMHNTHRRLDSGNAERTQVQPKHDRV